MEYLKYYANLSLLGFIAMLYRWALFLKLTYRYVSKIFML